MFVNKATSWTISGTANISKIKNQYASGVTTNIQGGNIGIIDNSSGSTVIITGGTIESTTNITISNGGTLRIQGGTIRSNNKYAIYNFGTAVITGGTITSTASTAIYNVGSLTIGADDASIPSTTVPEITGHIYGVQNTKTFNFYDGVITGETLAIYGTVTNLPQNYKVKYENHNTKATLTLQGTSSNDLQYEGGYYTDIGAVITLINNSASKKGTIFINADLMPENQIVIPEGTDITFVMQGYSIVYDGTDAAILNNGKLTIIDDEVEEVPIDPDKISMIINTNGIAIQNNGQLILGIDGEPNNTNSPIILGGVSENTPTIYDGEVRTLDTSGE